MLMVLMVRIVGWWDRASAEVRELRFEIAVLLRLRLHELLQIPEKKPVRHRAHRIPSSAVRSADLQVKEAKERDPNQWERTECNRHSSSE